MTIGDKTKAVEQLEKAMRMARLAEDGESRMADSWGDEEFVAQIKEELERRRPGRNENER